MSENEQAVISHGVGWANIGETDLTQIQWQPFPPGPDGAAEELHAIQWPISVTITVDATDALDKIEWLKRAIHQLEHPRKQGHCRTCHPEQDRRPLTVNGSEYHRRQRARLRGRRHAH